MIVKLIKEVVFSNDSKAKSIGSKIKVSDEVGKELIKKQEAIEYTKEIEAEEQTKIQEEVKNMTTKVEKEITAPNVIVKQANPLNTLKDSIIAMKKGKLESVTLKAPTGQDETDGADGQYLVIQGLDSLQGALELGAVIAPKCRKMNNFGPNEWGKLIPYRDESTLTTTSALRPYEVGEGGTKQATKMAFNRHDLKLATDSVLVYLTDEILSDVNYLQEYIIQNAGGRLAWLKDYNILKGTYSAAVQGCIGIFDAGATNFYTEPVAHNATYTGTIVNRIISGVAPELRNGAEWVMSNSVWATLVGALGTGTTVSTQPLFSNNNMTLGGYPINLCSQMSAFGSAGDILFGNFARGYTVAEKGGIELTISKDVAFLTDETVLRFTSRYCGAPTFRKYAPVDSVTVAAFSSTSGT